VKKKTVRNGILAGVSLAAIGAGGFSLYMSQAIAQPKWRSLAEEEEWERAHGLWGDFSEYETQKYTAAGWAGYTLHCELIPAAEESRRYVILSHGFGSNRYGSVKYVGVYRRLGFNCVIYDLRDHGDNEETACTIGNYESRDLLALIEDTYERYGEDIELGLHGESMGSSTSLSVLRFAPDVRFVVADCGFTNLYELIRTGFGQMGKGALNASYLTPLVNETIKLRFGFDMKDTSAVDALQGNTVPLCLIHGKADDFITPDNSEKLKAATAGCCELHLIDGAKHAQSREVLGEEAYAQIVAHFLERCAQGAEEDGNEDAEAAPADPEDVTAASAEETGFTDAPADGEAAPAAEDDSDRELTGDEAAGEAQQEE